jgi:hypothetical protein
MKAKSIKGKSIEEIKTSLLHSLSDGFRPTLAIIFISIRQDRQAISDWLTTFDIDIIGATSSGEFINGHQSEGETAILLMDMSREYYSILFEDIGRSTLIESAARLAEKACQKFKNPSFILLSTSIIDKDSLLDGETLIRSVERIAGPTANIFGGMAGDDISFTGTFVFTKEQSTNYGIAALVLNEEKITLQGMAISGWKPIGISRTITKSEDNLIYTIDNQPALDMYLRFLGSDRVSTTDQIDFFESLGNHYPFQIEREEREPMMCNPIGYDKEKGALICESNVAQGSRFHFSTPPDFDIIDTVIQKANELKTKTPNKADALLIFSCAGRLAALGPMAQQENEGLAEIWEAPMAGFYSYGEFGRSLNGKHEFHSTTNSWVALIEK